MSNVRSSAHQEQQWLYEVFERSPDPIVLRAIDGTIVNANDAFTKLSATPLNELRGKNLTHLLSPDAREKWSRDIEKLVQGQWTLVMAVYSSPSGRQVPVEIRLAGRTMCDGKPADILHFHDISVYHNVERALAASQRQWDRSFDAIADYMCVLDRSGKILRANRAMTQAVQDKYPDLVGQDYRSIFKPGELSLHASQFPDAVGSSPYTIGEISFQDIAGSFMVSAYPLKDENDILTGAVLIARNVTEQVRTREALKKTKTSLFHGAKMEALGRLSSGIAHDFNNMMAPIVGFSSLLLKTLKSGDPVREWVQEIADSAQRATALARQLLELSHGHPIETKDVNLTTIIRGMDNLLRTTLGENIKLALRLDEALWNVNADVSRLEQVFLNLAINARDAMPHGGQLSISTSNLTLGEDSCIANHELRAGNYVLTEFTDTGCGIPEDVSEHIFEPFFTTKKKGRGLGLATVYGIVRQFDGHIVYRSEVNKGTTFKLYLPQSPAASKRVSRSPTRKRKKRIG